MPIQEELYADIQPSTDCAPFPGGIAFLPFCADNPWYEGEHLDAIIDLMLKANSVIGLFTHTLSRHNLSNTDSSLSQQAAAEAAMKKGEEWKEKYFAKLKSARVRSIFLEWDQILGDSTYRKIRTKIEQHFRENKNFEEAVKFEAEAYLRRRGIEQKSDQKISGAITYVKEECAVAITVYEKHHFTHHCYPGSKSRAISMAFQLFNHPISWAVIEFHPKKKLRSDYKITSSDARLKTISAADDLAKYLEETTAAFRNHLIYRLQNAVFSTRYDAAQIIEKKVKQTHHGLELHIIYDRKSTVLIFAPAGQGLNPVVVERLDEYLSPKPKLAKMIEGIPDSFTYSCNVNLNRLQQDEIAFLSNSFTKDPYTPIRIEVAQAARGIQFLYSWLAYKDGKAPYVIICKKGSNYYIVPAYDKNDNAGSMQKIVSFLSNLVPEHLYEVKSTADSESRAVSIRIADPINLARFLYIKFREAGDDNTLQESLHAGRDKSSVEADTVTTYADIGVEYASLKSGAVNPPNTKRTENIGARSPYLLQFTRSPSPKAASSAIMGILPKIRAVDSPNVVPSTKTGNAKPKEQKQVHDSPHDNGASGGRYLLRLLSSPNRQITTVHVHDDKSPNVTSPIERAKSGNDLSRDTTSTTQDWVAKPKPY